MCVIGCRKNPRPCWPATKTQWPPSPQYLIGWCRTVRTRLYLWTMAGAPGDGSPTQSLSRSVCRYQPSITATILKAEASFSSTCRLKCARENVCKLGLASRLLCASLRSDNQDFPYFNRCVSIRTFFRFIGQLRRESRSKWPDRRCFSKDRTVVSLLGALNFELLVFAVLW